MKTGMITILACVALTMTPPGSPAAARDAGETVYKKGAVSDDYYAAGGTVNLDAQVAGDVTVAGGDVYINGAIQGDLMAAGGSVKIRGQVNDDIRTAGGDVDVDASVGDDLIASGGSVRIAPASVINGNAWLAGGDVYLAGTVEEDMMVAAANVRIAGTVNGDVEIHAQDIHILEGARINGNLQYHSPGTASTHDNAVINGTVTHSQVEWQDHSPAPGGFFFTLTLLVAGLVLFLVFPNFTMAATQQTHSDPLKSLGIGVLALLLAPMVAIILMVTVLGIWVGLALLLLYFIIVLVGFLVACFMIGERGAGWLNIDITSKGRRILSLVAAIVVIGLLNLLPFVGGILVFVLLLLGLGGTAKQLLRAYQHTAAARSLDT